MIDTLTLFRCGLVWLVCAVFLFDGSRFVRAQESDPVASDEKKIGDEEIAAAKAQDSNQYDPPTWFDRESEFTDENRMLFVRTRPENAMPEPADAKARLMEASIDAIRNLLGDWLSIQNPERIVLDPDYVLQNLVFENRIAIRRDLECETAMQNKPLLGNEFYGGYVQLHLNDEFRTYVRKQNLELTTQRRLIKGGLVGGSVLALLAVAFGYLKMETATRGFYSRRLQTVSLVVATTLLLLFYWFGQQL